MHIERQVLFLLHLKKSPDTRYRPCWAIIHCDANTKQHCPAWELQAGHMCWFINGTICHGIRQEDWNKKMELCRECSVFQTTMPLLADHKSDEEA
ncbi:MAG: two-CW domain-containing protein [Dissulfurispiraceae bacterium]